MLFPIGYQHQRGEKTQWYRHFTKTDKTADSSVYNANYLLCNWQEQVPNQDESYKANAHHTLKASIRYIKLSSNHNNLYTSTEKVQLSSCNCHIKAEEASSDITQHFCKAGSLLHQPFQFKPDSEPNTPSQTEEGSPPQNH